MDQPPAANPPRATDPPRASALTLSVDSPPEVAKMNFGHAIVLREDGKNCMDWKTMVPGYLQSYSWAWEATNGDLTPASTGIDADHYAIGNKSARTVFLNIIDPNLYVAEFFDDSQIVSAAEIWRHLQSRFHDESGLYRELAMDNWLDFEFSPSRSVEENITAYKRLYFDLTESKAGIPANGICSRLLRALPKSWASFKSAWSTKDKQVQTLNYLISLIRIEGARLAAEEGVKDATALMAKVGIRKKQPRYRHYQQRKSTSSNNRTSRTTVVTCWTCGQKGHKSSACRKGAPSTSTKKKSGRKPRANFAEVFMAVDCPQSFEGNSKRTRVIVDSGASHSVLNDASLFHNLKPLSDSREIRFGNLSTLKAQGVGEAVLIVRQGNKTVELRLREALLVPGLATNLISASKLMSDGFKVSMKADGITLSNGKVKVLAPCENGLYVLRTIQPVETNNLQIKEVISLREAHRCFSHIGKNKVKKILNHIGISYIDDLDICSACQLGKQHCQPNRTKPADARAHRPGFIHADTCSATETSLSGKKYFLCLTDDYSKFRAVYFLSRKDEVPDCI